ncbi:MULTISPECIES: LysR family transcriptional regulator [unclassified Caulobacter]|uniref:LysR family transcriptional regulator n=1 Tax=unclassified Caulobacter TaxID=2648921 RepID=UPI0006F3B464|nr:MULTISPECIES: LysR family transcriptional regulator [unclassified Caulobacter]KQV58346.1 LysR family transcriptional regulator [Caulobacter sp. Root342]KQV69147.1 LysR family transcriptional regulator [Caulobacter sp. Root343]
MRDAHVLRGKLDMLVAADVILDCENLTLAGQRLGLSQPAVSRTLGRLRAAFDDPLLVRVGGRMRPTPRAEALRAPLAAMLRAAEDLYAPAGFDPARARRAFRAVIPDVVAAVILPELLARLAKAAPACRLELLPWRPQAEQPRDLDLVITTEIDAFPDFRMKPLYQDDDILAFAGEAPSGDPLALEHVAVIAAGASRDPVDRWLAEQGRSRRIVAVVPHYLLALQLVARGGHVAVLPSRMVAALGAPLGVRGLELSVPQDPDQQWLMHPPQLEADAGNAWLREQVEAVAR